MHAHGTAVLPEPTATTPAVTTRARARDLWLAKCESQLAKALADRNADLLPVLPNVVFVPVADRCEDCRGTGHITYRRKLILCGCMAGDRPAYDFPRYDKAPLSLISASAQTPPGMLDVWVPCQHCGIMPTYHGPYHGPTLIRVPWVPDCPACNDTGWAFTRHIPDSYDPW
jgi:hypothetical protein